MYSPGSRAKDRRSAGSSGSSARCPRTATRSAATSARHGIETRRRSTRYRCSPTSTSTSAAPAITTDHELFVCLQIDAKLAWRQIKRAGGKQGPDAGACGVLLRELEGLAERLAAADVQVVGALRPGMLAAAIPRRLRSVVATRPRASRGGRPRPRRHRRGRGLAGRHRRRPGAATAPTARSTRPTGSPAGRESTSARRSSRRCSFTPRWCERSPSRSSRSRRCKAIREVEAARTTDVADQ